MSKSYWDEMETERKWTDKLFKWVAVPICVILGINCLFVWAMVIAMMTKDVWQGFIRVMFGS